MTNRFLELCLAINIIGLALISALESWRPGVVSSAVNIGFVWIAAVGLITIGVLLRGLDHSQQ